MKHTFSLSLTLLALMFFSVAVLSQTPSTALRIEPSRDGTRSNSVKKSIPATPGEISTEIAEALSVIENRHVDGKTLNYNELFKTTIDTMLHTLDPHSTRPDTRLLREFRIRSLA